jgi:hypothetical protein
MRGEAVSDYVSKVMGRCTLWYRVLLLTSAVQAETTLITEMIWGGGGSNGRKRS